MRRTVKIKLNKFSPIPSSIRANPQIDQAANEISIDLGRLYHHYYMDSYGQRPPNPNPANFEYLNFLTTGPELRFLGDGPATGTAKRRSISTEMGQAFCRYFLHDYLGISYFAHLERVLNKSTHAAFNRMEIIRSQEGDIPDYLCARSVNEPHIAEAKGRFTAISFKSKEFESWRKQFGRIRVRNHLHAPLKLKGYTVATRFVTENNIRPPFPTLLAEDPTTEGQEATPEELSDLGRGTIAIHYSKVVEKIGLKLMSLALQEGFKIPNEIKFGIAVWKCLVPPLEKMEFVGGFYTTQPEGLVSYLYPSEYAPPFFNLSAPTSTFIGVELNILKQLRFAVDGNWKELTNIPKLEKDVLYSSQLNWLLDGTVSGPIEFFNLIRVDLL